jgi:hypothetical protein
MNQYSHNFRAQDAHLDPPNYPEDSTFFDPEDEDTSENRISCPSCRHFVEPNVRRGGDENGFYRWLECPDCYEDITDSEEK